jgi:hypothetical protein
VKNEDTIKVTVQRFEDALRSMLSDGHTMHAFDVGTAPGEKQMFSILIVLAPKEDIDRALGILEAGVFPST